MYRAYRAVTKQLCCLSVCPSACLSACLSVYLSFCLPACLSVYLSVGLCVCVSVQALYATVLVTQTC